MALAKRKFNNAKMGKYKIRYTKWQIGAAILFLVGFIIYFLYIRSEKQKLRANGIKTIATIVKVGSKNFDYEYHVKGKLYIQKRTKVTTGMQAGQKFLIFYDQKHPDFHSADFSPLWNDSSRRSMDSLAITW